MKKTLSYQDCLDEIAYKYGFSSFEEIDLGATLKDRHTALYFALFDFILASVKLVKEAEDGDGYHKCPYCDAKHVSGICEGRV